MAIVWMPDPRDPQVVDKYASLPLPTPPPLTSESIERAEQDMHSARAAIVDDVAKDDITTALKVLLDLYPEADRAFLVLASVAAEHGPKTVIRHLVDVLWDRFHV